MGMVREWIKLIPTIIENRGKILEGIVNEVRMEMGTFPSDEQDEVIRRRAICAGCPYFSENAKKSELYATMRTDEHCIMCGCNIKAKTACLTCNCGIEKYNRTHPESTLELKWEKYGTSNK